MMWNAQAIRQRFSEGDLSALDTRFLLGRRYCPPDILANYAQSDYALEILGNAKQAKKVIAIARQHKGLPRQCIEEFISWGLQNYPRLDDLSDLFRNPIILTSDIDKLIESASNQYDREKVLRLTAHNPRFPVQYYEECITSKNSYIRSSIAANRALSVQMLERLLTDENPIVLSALVRNRVLRKESVAKLLYPPFDPAILTPNLLQNMITRLPDGPDFDFALEVLSMRRQDSATKQLITKLSRDPKFLAEMAVDKDVKVREMALKNPLTPKEAQVEAVLLGTPLTISKRGALTPRKRVW